MLQIFEKFEITVFKLLWIIVFLFGKRVFKLLIVLFDSGLNDRDHKSDFSFGLIDYHAY